MNRSGGGENVARACAHEVGGGGVRRMALTGGGADHLELGTAPHGLLLDTDGLRRRLRLGLRLGI